jgi:TonB family protein
MPRPVPGPWRKAHGFFLLLALILAAPNLQSQPSPPAYQRIEALGNESAARLLIHVAKPIYPAIAKINFIQGAVNLEITVDREGRVVETHVLDGEPLLAVAAIEAVRKWLYRPYVSPQGPTAFNTDVVVRFALHPHSFWGRFPTDPDSYLEKQVQPPEVITRPQQDPSAAVLRLKVLVDSKGKVLDATSPGSKEPEIEKARKNLETWKFRPAQWGAIAVPWYLIVKVPLEQATIDQVANSAKH